MGNTSKTPDFERMVERECKKWPMLEFVALEPLIVQLLRRYHQSVVRMVKTERDRFQLRMDLEVLDGSEESVIIQRSKMEACDYLIDALSRGGGKGKRCNK